MESIFLHDEMYLPILKSFTEDLPGMVKRLETSFHAGEIKKTHDLSHKLSGSAATFGFPLLADQFQKLEMLTSDGDCVEQDISLIFEDIRKMTASLAKVEIQN